VPITAALSHAIYKATDYHIPEFEIAKSVPTEHLQLRWRVVSSNKKVLYETRKLSDLYEFYDELSRLVKLSQLTFKLNPEQYSNSVSPREIVLGNCGARELSIFVAGGVEFYSIGSTQFEAQQGFLNKMIDAMLRQNPSIVKAIVGNSSIKQSKTNSSNKVNSLKSLSTLSFETDNEVENDMSSTAMALLPKADDLARCVLRNYILAQGIVKPRGLNSGEQQHLVLLAGKLKEIANGIALSWDCCMEQLDDVEEATALDVTEQLNWLVFPGYMRSISMKNLSQLMRYLEGIEARLTNAKLKPDVEQRKLREFGVAWQRYVDLFSNGARPNYSEASLQAYRWGVEEARLALWVPRLAQAGYSLKRLNALWQEMLSECK
jgi:hypothetical protein